MSDQAVTAALNAAFANHERDVPDAAALRPAIAAGFRRRRARRRWTVSGGVALALALVAVLPLSVLDRAFLDRSRLDRDTPPPQSLLSADAPDVMNLLLLGTDRRPQSAGDTVRADAILLLHVDPHTRTVYQLTIPRELLVDVPNFGRQQVNNAYVFGGYDLTSRVVGTLLGIQLDGGVVVDFTGMQRVTDAVGGVDLCVDQRTVSMHLGREKTGAAAPLRTGMQPVVYEPGCRHFAGWEALDYIRQRQSLARGGDDRDTHVRQFLAALARQLSDPVKLAKAMPVAKGALDLHLGDTSLPALAGALAGFDSARVPGLKLPVGQDHAVLPDGDGLFAALRAGTVPAWAAAHPQYVSQPG